MIWNNDDFFGGMFDFNGDGQTDAAEEALCFMILDEMSRKNNEEEDEKDDN